MNASFEEIEKRIIKTSLKYKNWAFQNWVFYNLLRKLFFTIFFPLVYLIGIISFTVEWVSWLFFPLLAVLICVAIITYLCDLARISVAQEKPADFIKVEKTERVFSISLVPIFLLSMVFAFVFTYSEKIGIPTEITSSILAFVLLLILIWTGLLIDFELSAFESIFESPIIIGLFKKIGLKGFVILPDKFYPSDNIRASARFAVLSQSLNKKSDKNVINKKFSLFYQGIKIYDKHIKDSFGFALREPKRFYFQARLAAYSKDNVDSIKRGIESLTELVKDDGREPFEIIKCLKEMLNEPTSFKDIREDIDADPHRIRKWLSVHSDLLIGITGIILAIMELFLFLLILH